MDHSTPAPFAEHEVPVLRVSGGSAVSYVTSDSGADGRSLPPSVVCRIYHPGHNVHFIQAGHALRVPATPYTLLDVRDLDLVVEHPAGGREVWTVHDTEPALAALLLEPRPVIHLHEPYRLARLGSALLSPRLPRHDPWQPCRAE